MHARYVVSNFSTDPRQLYYPEIYIRESWWFEHDFLVEIRRTRSNVFRDRSGKIWERWEKREEKRGEKARHRLKIPFAFSLPFPLSPGSALSAVCNICRVVKKKKKEEETNSLLRGEGGKEKGVFLREGKVSLTPSRRETRHSAAKRGKRGCHQGDRERKREREPPPLYGVWRRRWRRCRILASVARRSIDVQPPSARFLSTPSLSSAPPLSTHLSTTLAAPCVCSSHDRDSERKPVETSDERKFRPSIISVTRDLSGECRERIFNESCIRSNHSDKRFEIMLLSFRSVQSLTLSRSFSFFLFFFYSYVLGIIQWRGSITRIDTKFSSLFSLKLSQRRVKF